MGRMSVVAGFAFIVVSAAVVSADAPEGVPYPEGFHAWRHVKSMVIQEGHPLYAAFPGIHHIYANDKAVEGYAAGKFPDGSVLVFDLLAPGTAEAAIIDGRRQAVAVMHKDGERWEATGGWGFEAFAGGVQTEPTVGDEAATKCFSCHQPEAGHDYVFSRLRR